MLVEIFKAIQAQLVPTLQAQVSAMVPSVLPTFKLGQAAQFESDAPPRIVMIPTTEVITGPRGMGGSFDSQAPNTALTGGVWNVRPLARPLRARRASVQFEIWATSPDAEDPSLGITACEVLFNHLVAAIHAVAWGSYDITGLSWLNGQEMQNRLGYVCMADAWFDIPVTREPDYATVVNQSALTPAIVPIGS